MRFLNFQCVDDNAYILYIVVVSTYFKNIIHSGSSFQVEASPQSRIHAKQTRSVNGMCLVNSDLLPIFSWWKPTKNHSVLNSRLEKSLAQNVDYDTSLLLPPSSYPKNPSKFVQEFSSDPTLSTARLSPSMVKVEEYPLNHELHIDPVSGSRFRS